MRGVQHHIDIFLRELYLAYPEIKTTTIYIEMDDAYFIAHNYMDRLDLDFSKLTCDLMINHFYRKSIYNVGFGYDPIFAEDQKESKIVNGIEFELDDIEQFAYEIRQEHDDCGMFSLKDRLVSIQYVQQEAVE